MKQKITSISTMGSCSSRSIFNSDLNKNYKNYFKIQRSIEGVSIISLMSNPVEYDFNSINNLNRQFDEDCIFEDLSKDYLNFIKKNHVDYIIWDTLVDVSHSIIECDTSYITLTDRIKKTDFYKSLSNNRKLNIYDDFEEYWKLWVKSCDDFFDFIKKNCKSTKIILNCSRSVSRYYDSENNVKINEDFKLLSDIHNPFRDLLDKYILEHYDVEVLPFDLNTFNNPNHIFGLHPTHYEDKYYLEKNNQLLSIINRNKLRDFTNSKNKTLRKNQRKDVMKSFTMPKLTPGSLSNVQRKNLIKDTIANSLRKFNTARIDIKNSGNTTKNYIRLTNITDKNLYYYYPEWFEDSKGQGVVIENDSNFLKFDVECVGDGELTILLRGLDLKLNMDLRVPIYIKYTDFSINGKKIINESRIVSHDESYIFRTDVQDAQKLTIYLEWKPFETFNIITD